MHFVHVFDWFICNLKEGQREAVLASLEENYFHVLEHKTCVIDANTFWAKQAFAYYLFFQRLFNTLYYCYFVTL